MFKNFLPQNKIYKKRTLLTFEGSKFMKKEEK